MQQNEAIQTYVNLLAEALQILTQYTEAELSASKAAQDYTSIFDDVRRQLEEAKDKDATYLLETISGLLRKMNDVEAHLKVIYAEALSLGMDKLIDYADRQNIWGNGHFCLFDMVPIQNDRPFIRKKPLNDNWKEVGVCIMPKFPVSLAETHIALELKERSLSGRNMSYGINGDLINIGYYPWGEDTPNVHHVILSNRVLPDEQGFPSKTCIAFSPISDRQDILRTENKSNTEIGGFNCTGVFVNGVNNTEFLNARYAMSWEKACSFSPDVFFAPEMIATDEMAAIENCGSKYLKPLLTKVAADGKRPPRLTIMPTYWRNRMNKLLIFDETGKYVGEQLKRIAFIDEKNHLAEALITPPENTDILLIHLKNQQRIAFAICAEYLLGNEEYVSNFLCKTLGATLVLVPSYSKGEQDFLSAISAVKKYGTSVVWGNCCGAVAAMGDEQVERIIGACSYAGADDIHRFGEKKKCNSSCGEAGYCVFCVEIPTRVSQDKPGSMPMPEIQHLCE